jgi:hypothetical protein
VAQSVYILHKKYNINKEKDDVLLQTEIVKCIEKYIFILLLLLTAIGLMPGGSEYNTIT